MASSAKVRLGLHINSLLSDVVFSQRGSNEL